MGISFGRKSSSKFACPICDMRSLVATNSPGNSWFVCTACGSLWDIEQVKEHNAMLDTEVMCELCGERVSEIEFNMIVQIGPTEHGRPVGYRMVKGDICFDCFGSAGEDAEIAAMLDKIHQEKGNGNDEDSVEPGKSPDTE